MQLINIRPTTSVYATYQRLSYKPWFAIAEFVDNSTQSYFDHRAELAKAYALEENCNGLKIEIDYDQEKNVLVVFDNAFGMEIEDFTRALVLDSPPIHKTGRSEFGMGLKTAACWFGTKWKLESTELGSSRKLSATVDVIDLALHRTETIEVEESPADPSVHYTQLTISQVRHPIKGRTTGRVLDQLGSIYRQDLRSGEIQISWCGTPVAFSEPPILTEPQSDGSTKIWKKEVAFNVSLDAASEPLEVNGWIAIRNPARQRDAGLVLFRRNRVVMGGPEEGYRPSEIFGQGNSFRYQRLIGELHMDNWPVTQAKDAFDWADGLEDTFIESLKVVCQEYADYAELYRSSVLAERLSPKQMKSASRPVRRVIESPSFGRAIAKELEEAQPPASEDISTAVPEPVELEGFVHGPIKYSLTVGDSNWVFRLNWQDQITDAHWMQLNFDADNTVDIYLNMAHPFFAPYQSQPGIIELLQKLVIAMALAEQMARKASPDQRILSSDFRNYMNRVLRKVGDLEGPMHGER